ncbi:peptidyl-prolyl cis-trans isomerase SurA [Motilibacter rhizosphaerae]|uniref:Peptidyl-prolyl cis-trans isomerase SurA n=1 Tax=Motilibacter rhizosphaerae TaxID=598652 RepID=A0A4Q7NRT5_9ACTN|nr:hypothetical protein [Motilibacter rhizosphaerae]RZS87360.1 peptidyl-prolyl cis-trans isomerase SurA [Motilibacter rhizosphaerae]
MQIPVRSASALTLTVLLALGAAGCDPSRPGAAAVVGGTRISAASISRQVSDLEAESPGATGSDAVQKTLEYAVQRVLFEQVAARQHPAVTVSQGDLDALRAQAVAQLGGEQQLQQTLLQQDVPRSGTDDYLRLVVLSQKVGAVLVPGGAEVADQRDAAISKALQEQAVRSGIHVSPRFGRWDPRSGIVPLASGGLATPAAGSGAGTGSSAG